MNADKTSVPCGSFSFLLVSCPLGQRVRGEERSRSGEERSRSGEERSRSGVPASGTGVARCAHVTKCISCLAQCLRERGGVGLKGFALHQRERERGSLASGREMSRSHLCPSHLCLHLLLQPVQPWTASLHNDTHAAAARNCFPTNRLFIFI